MALPDDGRRSRSHVAVTADDLPPSVRYVRDRAIGRAGSDRRRIDAALTLAGVEVSPEVLAGQLFDHPVTINFHPDRIVRSGSTAGLTVAQSLLDTGEFLTQYRSGISAGSLTAHPGGDRNRWEVSLFGPSYASLGTGAESERPRYGGLNLAGHPDGACPRFGSCVLELDPSVLRRSTFSVGDSHDAPSDLGTVDDPFGVLAGLLEIASATGHVLNLPDGDVSELTSVIEKPKDGTPSPGEACGRALDDYVETQIHGPVDLATDVRALVIDPSFDGTADGEVLRRLAERFGFPLRRHPGFALAADLVGPEFRGPAIPAVAQRVQRESAGRGPGELPADDRLTAAAIGRAAVDLVRDPDRWADHADPVTTAQHLKQLWHTLVAFGDPIGPG